jgi:hypothetical protein
METLIRENWFFFVGGGLLLLAVIFAIARPFD